MSVSFYGKYIAEREGMGIVERPHGFASYKIEGDAIYLRDLYVLPDFRAHNYASEMADEVCRIGREKGCQKLVGSVAPRDPHATENLKVLLAYGMRLLSAGPDLIFFTKEFKWVA